MTGRVWRWLARIEWRDLTADALLLGALFASFVAGNDHVAVQCMLLAAFNLSMKRGRGFINDRWTYAARTSGV